MSMECPASMCPLFAKDGSPWTGVFAAPCPGHDELPSGGCPWWSVACSTGGIQSLVEGAAVNDGMVGAVAGPTKPKRGIAAPREFDCPRASVCRWQEQSEVVGRRLCPPRDALARGIDPRVVAF